ncbi:MAG: S8 family peptidase [Syntrophobacteraceae bacterium]|nr:S8 family peptidase [Syntrophobacteraceae bacterium]
MPITLPHSLVEYILLGPAGDRRQLQDSPILGDVWIAYAKDPGKPQELLITPHRAQTAGIVAAELDRLIEREPEDPADIAYLQGIIAARLRFTEVLAVIVPMTDWWQSPRIRKDLQIYLEWESGSKRIERVLGIVQKMLAHWSAPAKNQRVDEYLSAFDRYAALAGLILWASGNDAQTKKRGFASVEAAIADAIKKGVNGIAESLRATFIEILRRFPVESPQKRDPMVFQISLNREATMALTRSVPAVKADAARTLFSVKCSQIAWAVIDSGINGEHAAFKGPDDKSRVKSSFDFSNFRKIVSLDNLRILSGGSRSEGLRAERLQELLHDNLKERLSETEAVERLTKLAEDARSRRPIHWEYVRPFVEIGIETAPRVSDHGTHVAGILGASREGARRLHEDVQSEYTDGMCPDIQIYDFRVLAPTIRETEFAIIATLQYIRYMNQLNDYMTIHGVNLSLSIPHDVRNYACGRTPVCVECEHLVDSGVVVVAAAGNLGYQSFETREGSYESYAAFSVTDPGNADGVITVGATHRYSPHTYGVSFFSSRGPTGDGRLKPDLVAPGERIRAPFREGWGDLDGTSMAAPHVSGAAAMLMARYAELIGEPRRIKRILCESATDLGRERSFQGHGMLDVLRAFQKI